FSQLVLTRPRGSQSRWFAPPQAVLIFAISKGKKERRAFHAYHHHGRWHDDLLQGLGLRSAHRLLAWLATQRRRLGRADAVLRAARLSRHRARPARSWALRSD